ncbi:putative protein OS=Ureibacillus acetophenoni OX=614649 GN=SAMN05877842_11217 PE=4 SV=1 [Ureibacillus acetophenoni]
MVRKITYFFDTIIGNNSSIEGMIVLVTDRHAVKSIEQIHIKHVRHFYRSIAAINIALAEIHKKLEDQVNKQSYRLVTEYINQFISYTSVWNVKFAYNLESPEVAMLQIFHLDYILEQESPSRFICERSAFEELKEKFFQLDAFKIEHIQLRKQKI